MNVRETWVVYDDKGNLRSYGTSERQAWRNYATDISAMWLDSFIRTSEADGWRCLRVVPAEGQE
jgi:hypothetical protein